MIKHQKNRKRSETARLRSVVITVLVRLLSQLPYNLAIDECTQGTTTTTQQFPKFSGLVIIREKLKVHSKQTYCD